MFEDVILKVDLALDESEYDAILVFGPDNVRYLSGAHLPFHQSFADRHMGVLWPKGGEPVCICPVEWESSFLSLSWINSTCRYIEELGTPGVIIETIAPLVEASVEKGGKIGVDARRVSSAFYTILEEALNRYELEACDSWLGELRMTKTSSELEFLSEIAYRTDHGILGATHHVLVTSVRSEMSLSEEIRVHCMERGLDVVGHHSLSQVASGEHAGKFWPLAPKYGLGYDKHLKPDEYVRLEMRASLDGYWSDAARLMTMGEPTDEQISAYMALIALRDVALERLTPGEKCSEVYEAVKEEAKSRGVKLVQGLAIGHGIGVTDHEPPFLRANDDTELEDGMVLVLDPVIYGPKGEILRSKDIVILTEDGPCVVGWYKDWREPYIANHTL